MRKKELARERFERMYREHARALFAYIRWQCGDDVGVQGETDTSPDPSLGGSAGEQDQQPTQSAPQQVVASSGGDELPFTGFAAIPIVVIGAMLIAAGALLRRRTQP